MSDIFFGPVSNNEFPPADPAALITDFSIVGWKYRVFAMIDTGCPISTVPIRIMKEMGIRPDPFFAVVASVNGHDGGDPRDCYDFKIRLCKAEISVTGARGGHEEFVRLGRDVLCQRKLFINWKNGGESKVMLPDEPLSA